MRVQAFRFSILLRARLCKSVDIKAHSPAVIDFPNCSPVVHSTPQSTELGGFVACPYSQWYCSPITLLSRLCNPVYINLKSYL